MQSEDDMGYKLLQQIDQEPAASQSSLAARLGVNVGKGIYCLRALLGKGWVKSNNFLIRSETAPAVDASAAKAPLGPKVVQISHSFI